MLSFLKEIKLIIIGAVLLLIAIAGLVIINRRPVQEVRNVSPSQQNAVQQINSKTYSDESLGLSFKYDKDWGDVVVTKGARIDKKFEPIDSYGITFENMEDFIIKISPTAWSFSGGNVIGDAPVNAQTFQQNYSVDTSVLQLMQTDTGYLNMLVNTETHQVTMKGAKQLSLPKLKASYAEFVWQPVSDSCAVELSSGVKRATASCYEQARIDGTKFLLNNFNIL